MYDKMLPISYHPGNTNGSNERPSHTYGNGPKPDTDTTECGHGWGAAGTLFIAGGNANCPAVLEGSSAMSYKAKHTLTIGCSNCTLAYLHQGIESYVHTKTCTQMFPAALFTNAKTCKQPGCPSVGEWINGGTSRRWDFTWCKKEMSSQALRRRGPLKAYY